MYMARLKRCKKLMMKTEKSYSTVLKSLYIILNIHYLHFDTVNLDWQVYVCIIHSKVLVYRYCLKTFKWE